MTDKPEHAGALEKGIEFYRRWESGRLQVDDMLSAVNELDVELLVSGLFEIALFEKENGVR